MEREKTMVIFFALCLMAYASCPVLADIPRVMNVQGRLMNMGGGAASGTHAFLVKLDKFPILIPNYTILEIKEAAKDAATIIIGAPVLNKITDFCYEKLIRSRVHRILHKSAQEKIIGSVKRHLIIEKIVHYPFFLPLDYSLFFVLRATKRGERCLET